MALESLWLFFQNLGWVSEICVCGSSCVGISSGQTPEAVSWGHCMVTVLHLAFSRPPGKARVVGQRHKGLQCLFLCVHGLGPSRNHFTPQFLRNAE